MKHQHLRILIVDDDVRQMLSTMLNNEPGIRVLGETSNGLAALTFIEGLAKQNNACPDVMVLDLNMPRMNGLDVLHRLRMICPRLKVVVFSGEDQTAAMKVAEIGDYTFVPKSNLEKLINTLRSCHQPVPA